MPYDSNIDQVSGWLDATFDEIGWDIPAGSEGATSGAGSTLGGAVMDTVIDGIQARSLVRRGADPAGGDDSEWPENTAEYAAEKDARYGQHNPNFRTTQMLSRRSLTGARAIGHETATWIYGTGEPASNAKTRHDRRITDVEKAHYAESGQSEHQVRRPFFAVAESDADDAVVVVESAIGAHFDRKASGR